MTGLVHPSWPTRPQPPSLRSLAREIITSRGKPAARAVAVAVSCQGRAHPQAAWGCFAAGRSAATGQVPGRHRLMRHVDRPTPGRLVSRRLRLLAAGRPTGLLAAGCPTGLLTVAALLTVAPVLIASRGAAGVLLIGLFQSDLFPDGLIFPRGFLISRFLAGRLAGPGFLGGGLAGPRFLGGRLAGPRFLGGRLAGPHLLGWRLLIGGLMIGGLPSGGFVISQPGRASHVRSRPGSPRC